STRWSAGSFLATSHLPEQVQAPGARDDEERADQVADAAAVALGDDDHYRADEHRRHREEARGLAVDHATRRAAATITRDFEFLSTKSTVFPKIALRPGWRARGAPTTMISACRRSASSMIAPPAWRAPTRR